MSEQRKNEPNCFDLAACRIEVRVENAPTENSLADFIPSAVPIAVGLFSIFAVHLLTRRREREKTVFELQRSVAIEAKELRSSAVEGWTTTSKAKRERLVRETIWRLQRIGSLIEQMRRLSKRKRWFVFGKCAFDAKKAVAKLRDALTLGEFDDLTRGPRPNEASNVDKYVGEFLDEVDLELFEWLR